MVVEEQTEPVVRGELALRGRRQRKKVQPNKEGFDNLSYWESRYVEDPERGSGVGSRGKYLDFKREMLDALIAEINPRSILDVGCGDLEVARDLRFDGAFTGIDLSPSIIERNRELRPDWTFIEGDFVGNSRKLNLRADLVICFDVLIHQHEKSLYRKFVRRLLGATERVLVVNGFDKGGQVGKQKHICAFHEPLSGTLEGQMRPGWQMREIGKFRSTPVYQVDKEPGAANASEVDAENDAMVFGSSAMPNGSESHA